MAKPNKKAASEYGGMLTFEDFRMHNKRLGLSEEGYRRIYERLSDEDVKKEIRFIETGYAEFDIFASWDMPLDRGVYPTKIPQDIRISGDENQLQAYLDENENDLSAADMAYMIKHIEVARKTKTLADKAAQDLADGQARPPKPEVIVETDGSLLLNIRQPSAQSTPQGCWSVAMQLLIQSRGKTDITQEDIRAYRPDPSKITDLAEKQQMDATYNNDGGAVAYEMMDALLKLSPNTMVRSTEILPYDPSIREFGDKGITAQQYHDNAKELIRQTVEKAILIDHSPLIIREPGHFLNVVGIRGDVMLVQDPRYTSGGIMTETRMREIPIDTFVTRMLEGESRDGIQLMWGSDIQLDKTGKIIGLPDENIQLSQNGEVELNDFQKDQNSSNPPVMKEGKRIARLSGKCAYNADGSEPVTVDGLRRVDQVYLPSKIDIAGLKKEAELRPEEEEQKRKQEAELYFTDMQDLKGASVKTVLDKGLDEAHVEADERKRKQEAEAQKKREEAQKEREELEKLTEEERLELEEEKRVLAERDADRREHIAYQYAEDLLRYKNVARELLEDLRISGVDTWKDPVEYLELVNALQDMCDLSLDNTPADVTNTLQKLTIRSDDCRRFYHALETDEEYKEYKKDERFKTIQAVDNWFSRNTLSVVTGGMDTTKEANTPIRKLLSDPVQELQGLRTEKRNKELSDSAVKLEDELFALRETLKKHQNVFRGLNKTFGSDSEQYTKMRNVLEKACGLSNKNSLYEIHETIGELATLTQNYMTKIEREDGGKSRNGSKRYNEASKMMEVLEESRFAGKEFFPSSFDEPVDIGRPLQDMTKDAVLKKVNEEFAVPDEAEIASAKQDAFQAAQNKDKKRRKIDMKDLSGSDEKKSKAEEHKKVVEERRSLETGQKTEDGKTHTKA